MWSLVDEAQLADEITGGERKQRHALGSSDVADHSQRAADNDVKMVVGRSLPDQDFIGLEVAEPEIVGERLRLFVRELRAEARMPQCFNESLIGHDGLPRG